MRQPTWPCGSIARCAMGDGVGEGVESGCQQQSATTRVSEKERIDGHVAHRMKRPKQAGSAGQRAPHFWSSEVAATLHAANTHTQPGFSPQITQSEIRGRTTAARCIW
eukprot:588342-Prymnesium_polylepis.1